MIDALSQDVLVAHRSGGMMVSRMWRAFAGEDYEQAYVPTEARAVLKRFDARSVHYEVREKLSY